MCCNSDYKRAKSFDDNAYLSMEAEYDRKTIMKNFSDIFDLSKRVNTLANKMKFEFSIDEQNGKQKIMCGLFLRIIKSFNSAIILYEYGLEQDAIAISRIMIEGTWKFSAIYKNEEYFKNYLLEDRYTLIKLKNKVGKNLDNYSEGFLERIKVLIKEKGVENAIKPKPYKTYEIAELAEMEDSYRMLYERYSSHVHSDSKSISDCFYVNEGEIEFDILPKTNEIEGVLALNIQSICWVLIIWNTIFDLKYGAELEKLQSEVVQIFEKLNKERVYAQNDKP